MKEEIAARKKKQAEIAADLERLENDKYQALADNPEKKKNAGKKKGGFLDKFRDIYKNRALKKKKGEDSGEDTASADDNPLEVGFKDKKEKEDEIPKEEAK